MKQLHLWILGLLVIPLTALAIVIEPGVPDSKYLVSTNAFPPLVELLGEGQGTLIRKQWVVTAAHATHMMRLMPKRDHDVIINGKKRDVIGVFVYPGFDKQFSSIKKLAEHPTAKNRALLMTKLERMHDIALIKLAKPVEDVRPVELYTGSNEQGKIAEIYGRGATGNGRVGEYPHSPHQGKLRRAYNRINSAHAQWLSYRFNCGAGAVPLEGVLGDGDSGGPVLIKSHGKWLLAGLSDWKHWPKGYDKFHAGVCGQEFSNSRISYFVKWIDSVIAAHS